MDAESESDDDDDVLDAGRMEETMAEVKLHYRTLGTAQKGSDGRVTNAVWIGHGTGGTGTQFLSRNFAGELFGPGQPLDATRYFIILPDHIGHGASSKPSNGLRAKFPKYGYRDMVDLQYRLVTEGLGVNHMRLVMGTSMGGMHTWMWGQMHPTFMDALMPLASIGSARALATQVSAASVASAAGGASNSSKRVCCSKALPSASTDHRFWRPCGPRSDRK